MAATWKKKVGRRPIAPSVGERSLAQVAEVLGVSYSTVYRLVVSREVCARRTDDSGVIWIDAASVEDVREALRPPAASGRTTVQVTRHEDVVRRWRVAIDRATPHGCKPPTLAEWLAELADTAADRILS